MSVQRSCRCIGLSRAAYYRNPVAQDRDAEVVDAINVLLQASPLGFLEMLEISA